MSKEDFKEMKTKFLEYFDEPSKRLFGRVSPKESS
jgi:hypothetical protein